MAEFGLKKSFDIDDGQLDGMTPQQCFVLGYELGEIDRELQSCMPIDRLVHAANRERIKKSLNDRERQFTLEWLPNDVSEEWLRLRC